MTHQRRVSKTNEPIAIEHDVYTSLVCLLCDVGEEMGEFQVALAEVFFFLLQAGFWQSWSDTMVPIIALNWSRSCLAVFPRWRSIMFVRNRSSRWVVDRGVPGTSAEKRLPELANYTDLHSTYAQHFDVLHHLQAKQGLFLYPEYSVALVQ